MFLRFKSYSFKGDKIGYVEGPQETLMWDKKFSIQHNHKTPTKQSSLCG